MEVKHAAIFALSLLFLVASSNASGPLVVGCNEFSVAAAPGIPLELLSVSLLALLVSFDVVAIGYILSKVFANQGFSGWVNNEFWEMAKTALLIVGIIAILSLLGSIASLIAPPQLVTQPQSATYSSSLASLAIGACEYLNGQYSPGGYVSASTVPNIPRSVCAPGDYIYETACGDPTTATTQCSATPQGELCGSGTNSYISGAFTYLLALGSDLGTLKNMTISAWVPIPPPPAAELSPVVFTFGFSMMPYQNRMLETNSQFAPQYASIINDLFTYVAIPIMILMAMQYYMLPLVFTLGLVVVIPMGLVLRAFPFVRGIGGMLIALGIGMSLIYPSLLVMLNYPVTQAIQSGTAPTLGGSACNNLICDFVIGFAGAGNALESVNSIFPALNGVLYYGTYFLLQFVLFILDLAIAFPLVDNIAKLLGGSIRIQLGKKLKLV